MTSPSNQLPTNLTAINDPDDEELLCLHAITLIDLDEAFNSNPNRVVVNNDVLVSNKLSKEINDVIFSKSDGELGFVPHCQCGHTSGLAKEGLTCPLCNTVCSSQFVNSLTQNAWLSIPDQFPPVLHPVFYLILRKWTCANRKNKKQDSFDALKRNGKNKSESDTSIIDCILDPRADLPDDLVPYLTRHGEDIRKCRGFSYFHEHADEIINILAYEYPRTAKKATTPSVIAFIKHYRPLMFIRHIPILHNSLHLLKSNGDTLKYTDNTSKYILTAIVDLSLSTFKLHSAHITTYRMNTTLYKIYSLIHSYHYALIREKLGRKHALLRKHVFGSRTHFSARSVVTPHDKVLPFDELILPWKMTVNLLKLQILNLLMHRRKMLLEEALTKFLNALVQYDPVIDEVIQTIIAEFPGGRMPVAVGRNPKYLGIY